MKNYLTSFLDSGVLPEVWSVGLIKPIYKQKGERKKQSREL